MRKVKPPAVAIARLQLGLGMVAALIVLVMLAALAAAAVRMSFTQEATSGQSSSGARAEQAAGTGIEWGLYQALHAGGSWAACSNASRTLDLRADMGMWVTVTCNARTYYEGKSDPDTDRAVVLYTLEAVACNGASACPDNSRVGSVGYVERKRAVQATNP